MAFLPKYPKFRKTIGDLPFKDYALAKIFIGVATVLLISTFFPRGEAIEFEYKVGGIWVEKDLIAPFSFSIYKDEQQYEQEKRESAAKVAPVYFRDDHVSAAQRESLLVRLEELRGLTEFRTVWAKREELVQLLVEIFRVGIVDNPAVRRAYGQIAIRRGTAESVLLSSEVHDIEMARALVESHVYSTFGDPMVAQRSAEIVRSILKPNLIFSREETDKLIQVAIDNVPRTVGYVQANERIIAKHEPITPQIKLKLDSLRRARADRGAEHGHAWQFVGVAFHVALVTALYGIYLFLFRKRIYHNNRRLILIAFLLAMQCFFAYITLQLEVQSPIQYLIFVPATSMLLAIMFDSRVAFYGTVTAAFLVAGIRGNDYSIALAVFVAGALSVYTVRDIKHRTQIFRSLVFIFLGYALVIMALGLERFAPLETVVMELVFAMANAVFSPVLAYGLLIFFERVFRVTTDLTLLELSDFNHPVLRELSEKAPGTFHHSITLGNLAEAAAEAIGARAILARVGAYYHDIGKVGKPEYFTENQQHGKSKHNRLRPRMSALIIASHVKDGLELGREHGLPEVVLDFIPQHHGTTIMSFFYDKALRLAEEKRSPKYEVHETDYRYPGPKPQSKETAIVMLADAVEATARSMDDPTPQKLEAMIDSTIRNRFVEGQLDECELTLRDLSKIKEAFLKILIGIHHTRVKYPDQEEREEVDEEQTPMIASPQTVESPVETEHTQHTSGQSAPTASS
jgi:putative nucleotidyltransferase with HDIG domain